jgi:hypothetical protein
MRDHRVRHDPEASGFFARIDEFTSSAPDRGQEPQTAISRTLPPLRNIRLTQSDEFALESRINLATPVSPQKASVHV